MEIRGDLAIDGLSVARWALLSAPRRIELSKGLEARLAPVLG